MSMYQKQLESEKLNADIEKWLAQNSIKSLPMGFTHYPDGNIPIAKSKPKNSESERLEREKKIAEKNELIRVEREAAKKAKAEQLEILKRIKAQKLAEERAIKKAEREAKRIEEKKLKALKKVSKLKLVKFKEWDARAARIQINNLRKREALQNGENYFPGVCVRHGETRFAVWKNTFRCVKCNATRNQNKRVKENHPEFLRRVKNRELRDQALSNGVYEFIGECRHHGEVKFCITGSENRHRCSICRSEVKANCQKKTHKNPRIVFNRIARDEAIQKGSKVFIGECEQHGKTDFKVNITTKYSYCVECRRETQRETYKKKIEKKQMSARFVRSQANRQKCNDAIELGRKDFTGECVKHGLTRFVVYKDGKGVLIYKCRACKTEISRKSNELRKQAYIQNPNNVALIDYLKKSELGELTRVASAMGLTRSALSNYVTGRAMMSDERFEQFKRVIGGEQTGVAA